jgi:hypothetical protein
MYEWRVNGPKVFGAEQMAPFLSDGGGDGGKRLDAADVRGTDTPDCRPGGCDGIGGSRFVSRTDGGGWGMEGVRIGSHRKTQVYRFRYLGTRRRSRLEGRGHCGREKTGARYGLKKRQWMYTKSHWEDQDGNPGSRVDLCIGSRTFSSPQASFAISTRKFHPAGL